MENLRRDLYSVIGVSRDATQKEIEEACLRLGETYRPGRNAGDADATRRFSEIEQAFAVLADPSSRAAYDQELATAENTPAASRIPQSKSLGFRLITVGAVVVLIALGVLYLVLGKFPPNESHVASGSAPTSPAPAPKPGRLAMDAYHALKRLEAATESGIVYADYGRRLGETWFSVKTYLESPEAQAGPDVVDAMKQTMIAYNKAAAVWRVLIENRYSHLPFGPESREPTWASVLKYDVPDLDRFLVPMSYDSRQRQYRLKDAISGYWGDASAALRKLDPMMR